MPVQDLSGLNEISAGILEGAQQNDLTGLLFLAAPLAWTLGLFGRKHGRFGKLPLAGGWTDGRDLPAPEGDTFFARYAREQRAGRVR